VAAAAVALAALAAGLALGPWHPFGSGQGAGEGASPPPSPGGPVGSGGPTLAGLRAGWLKDENARPGSTGWHLARPSRNGAIEGYANTVSAQRGDSVSLHVSTTARSYTVQGFRMGYYGGMGARLVWTSSPLQGLTQARPTVARGTNMVEASWSVSLTVVLDQAWPPGDYLFKLLGDNGFQSYIPLTVRDDASSSALLINNSVTTWQAYNLWDGYDLYSGRSGRSNVVSFDRPYMIGDGSGDFLGNEYPLISLVESLGLDVSYTTDIDLHERPQLVLRHKALISLGHDEYWSTSMRDGVETARDHGVNIAFLGANAVFRHIRLQPSPLGPNRHEVNYRSAATDPMTGINNAEVTVSWREPPVNRPENTLLGELYQCNPVHNDFIVTERAAWVYVGTGLLSGSKIIGLIGSEYDAFVPGMAGPPNVEIMAHSPLRCRGTAGYSDFTYYVAPSGAGVIDVGTNNWVPLLTNPGTQPALVQITENILTAFATGPAGRVHPSTPNYTTLPRGSFPRPSRSAPSEEAPVTRPTRPPSRSTIKATTTAPSAPSTSSSAPPTSVTPSSVTPSTVRGL
jgi:hypothetical protein